MYFGLLMTAALGAAPVTRVVYLEEDLLGALEFYSALRADERLIVGGPDIASAATIPTFELRKPTKLLAQAREAFVRLNADAARELVREAREALWENLDKPEAVETLAAADRLLGRIALLYEDDSEAIRAFRRAIALQPDFVPDESEWPPRARRVYKAAREFIEDADEGSLSIRVRPSATFIWLDGVPMGWDSRTVTDLTAGEHYLLARCPGYRTFAGIVDVEGEGRISEISVFLRKQRDPFTAAVALVAQEFRTPRRKTAIGQATRLLGTESLIVVGRRARSVTVWVFNQDGEQIGGSLELVAPREVARAVAGMLLGEQGRRLQAQQWYHDWRIWAATGAGALALGMASYFILRPDPQPRYSFGDYSP